MKVTVFLLNYNQEQLTLDCLKSLKRLKSMPFKVVLIDNGSTHNPSWYATARKILSNVKIVKFATNLGYAGGMNAAVAQEAGKSEYLVFLNNDTKVENNWLDPLINCLKLPRVGAVQSKIRSMADHRLFEYAGAAGGYLDMLGYPYALGRKGFNQGEVDHGQYDQVRKIFWASGTSFAVKSEVFRALGGFDNDFFAYQEEIDLCWRIQRLGLDVYFVPQSVVYHVGMATSKSLKSRRLYLVHRNNLQMLIKNLSPERFLYVVPLRILMDYGSALLYLVKNSPFHAATVIQAHIDVLRNIKATYRKRSEISRLSFIDKQLSPQSSLARRLNYHALLLVVVLIGIIVIRLPALVLPFDRDEGVYAYTGNRWLLHNDVPYLTSFDHKGPVVYLLWGLFANEIFGQSGIRLFTTLLYLVCILGIYKSLVTSKGRLLAWTIIFWIILLASSVKLEGWNSNVEMLFTPLLALVNVHLLSQIITGKRLSARVCIGIGLLWGAVMMSKSSMAILLLPQIAMLYLVNSNKKILVPIVSILFIAIVLVAFWKSGAITPFLYANLSYNIGYVATGYNHSGIKDFFKLVMETPISIVLSLFLSAILILRNKSKLVWVYVCLIVSVAVYTKSMGIRYVGHYLYPFAWIVPLTLICAKNKKISILLSYVFTISFFVTTAHVSSTTPYQIYSHQYGTQSIWFYNAQNIAGYAMSKCSSIYSWTNEPQIYYFAKQRSPNYFINFYTMQSYPNGEALWLEQLKPTECIITYDSPDDPMWSYFKTWSQNTQYAKIANIDGYFLWKKNQKLQ